MEVCCRGLPFGGAKRGIMADPNVVYRVAWIKSFAKMIRPYCPSQYIAATDVGTTELDMAVFAHGIDGMWACTGKPAELGGIPHESGTTGYGVSVAFKTSLELLKGSKPISFNNNNNNNNNNNISHNKNGYEKELRVTIQGFGDVESLQPNFLSWWQELR